MNQLLTTHPLVKHPEAIRLGMIGMTPGNGHPYSWSAIFNNYCKEAMSQECPFPGIPDYLNKVPNESIGVPGAFVTHVCCDKKSDALHVSKLSNVAHVVDSPEEMLGEVDAVIIATDIGSEHVKRARFWMEHDVPLLIDKPLCDTREDLAVFLDWNRQGKKFMSASSMRYCKEYSPFHRNCFEFGQPRLLVLTMPKQWKTYGIHALESVYPILGPGFHVVKRIDTPHVEGGTFVLRHDSGADIVIENRNDIWWSSLMIVGTKGETIVRCQDHYTAFRRLLLAFIEYLRTGTRPFDFEETREVIELLADLNTINL